jgi:hypothetical protein
MNTLSSGIQLIEPTYYPYLDIKIIEPIVFLLSLLMIMVVDVEITKTINKIIVGFIAVVVIGGLACVSLAVSDRTNETYDANKAKLHDSYGISLNNGDYQCSGSCSHYQKSIAQAKPVSFTVFHDDMSMGTEDTYKITIDEHKVLRVFQPKDQDTEKTWVEVQPQQ